jgi:hypothetical protein
VVSRNLQDSRLVATIPRIDKTLNTCKEHVTDLKQESREALSRIAILEGKVESMQDNSFLRMTQMEDKIRDLNEFVSRENDYYQRIEEGDNLVRQGLQDEMDKLMKEI